MTLVNRSSTPLCAVGGDRNSSPTFLLTCQKWIEWLIPAKRVSRCFNWVERDTCDTIRYNTPFQSKDSIQQKRILITPHPEQYNPSIHFIFPELFFPTSSHSHWEHLRWTCVYRISWNRTFPSTPNPLCWLNGPHPVKSRILLVSILSLVHLPWYTDNQTADYTFNSATQYRI